jgi:hypothetical protein
MAFCYERLTIKKNWIEFELDYHFIEGFPCRTATYFLGSSIAFILHLILTYLIEKTLPVLCYEPTLFLSEPF